MQTAIIDKLYLELSQVSEAKTKRELKMFHALLFAKDAIMTISSIGHSTGYDWNADPNKLTLLEGDALRAIESAVSALR